MVRYQNCKTTPTPKNNNNARNGVVSKRKSNPQRQAKNMASGTAAKQTVSAPVARATILRTTKPLITPSTGGVRVRHSEYIGEVFGSINFNATKYTIQPGFASTFPWLSLMAPLYERYRVHKMQFMFLTEKSTATNGTVMMAVDYDVQDADPGSKTALLSYANAVRTQPWADTTFTCNVSDAQIFKDRYIRSAVVSGADNKTFDIGNFFIATQGCIDASVLGELHVSYEIEFRTPQLDLGTFASSGSNFSTSNSSATGFAPSIVLGTSPIMNIAGSGLNITYNTANGDFTFNTVGSYLVIMNVTATATNAANATATASGGSTVSLLQQAGTVITSNFTWSVNIKNATDVVRFTLPLMTSVTFVSMRTASYPTGL